MKNKKTKVTKKPATVKALNVGSLNISDSLLKKSAGEFNHH